MSSQSAQSKVCDCSEPLPPLLLLLEWLPPLEHIYARLHLVQGWARLRLSQYCRHMGNVK